MDVNSDKEHLIEVLEKASLEYSQLNEKYEDEMSKVCQLQQKIKAFSIRFT